MHERSCTVLSVLFDHKVLHVLLNVPKFKQETVKNKISMEHLVLKNTYGTVQLTRYSHSHNRSDIFGVYCIVYKKIMDNIEDIDWRIWLNISPSFQLVSHYPILLWYRFYCLVRRIFWICLVARIS